MRITISYLLFIPLAGMVFCCTPKPDVRAESDDTLINTHCNIGDIILVNAKYIDRCQMGKLINAISKCSPKVIGVNFLFRNDKEPECDSILRSSIAESEKVVLIEGFENGTYIASNLKFTEVSYSSGLAGLVFEEDNTFEGYHKVYTHRGKKEFSFPFILALHCDTNKVVKLASTLTLEKYSLNSFQPFDAFKSYEYDDDFQEKCDLIKNKIVLVGYLGPYNEDIFLVSGKVNSERAFGTVILANVILDIFKDFD